MKPKVHYDSIRQRYLELKKTGMDEEEATMRIGKLVLHAYGLNWSESPEITLYPL